MGQQEGYLPIKGTMGNLTFYKSGDSFKIKRKGGSDKNRIASDPAFERTRENGAEFSRAGLGSKVVRTAFLTLFPNSTDTRMTGRLTREMMKVVKSDTTSPRGQRNIIDGKVALLEGFEFNGNSKLSTSLLARFTATVNRVTGELTISVPSFNPSIEVAVPQGATHYKIVSSGAELDFESGAVVSTIKATADLPWNKEPTADINLVSTVTANSTKPLFIVLGIQFSQQVNGIAYALKSGAYNSLAIVKVDEV